MLAAHRAGSLGVAGLNDAITQRRQDRWHVAARERQTGWWTGRVVLVTENHPEHGLWNGDVGVVVRGEERFEVVFAPELAGSPPRAVPAANLPAHETAFAMTVHKAQGSQWDDVVLFDESGAFREHRARWLYTGLTRAAKKLTVVM